MEFSLEDPTGAPVPAAACTLNSRGTGASLRATSGPDGAVSFLNVLPGSYDLSVTVGGFKTLEVKAIAVTSSQVRTLGKLTLQMGEVRESVNVTGETSVLQLASAERAGQITTRQIGEIPIKGRDIGSLLRLVPGVVSTAASLQTPVSLSNISINGSRSRQKNPTVDGITNLDTGSNDSLHLERRVLRSGQLARDEALDNRRRPADLPHAAGSGSRLHPLELGPGVL